MASSKRRKLYVGVDYGTTFSGIAYALPTIVDWKGVEVVRNWPGRHGTNNELLDKVPSVIAYRRKDASESSAKAETLWGYDVHPSNDYDTYSWTKLLLERPNDKMDHVNGISTSQEPGVLRLPPGKTAVDVVTDYLKNLYQHCMTTLEKHYADFLAMTPIEFWFTMPAIWSEEAQTATRQAAKNAGFGSRLFDEIRMITEPEAGVYSAMKSQEGLATQSMKPGTGLLVCDCGGGTVDLASYVIDSLEPLLQLRESCAGDGDKCGATFIDRRFLELMCCRFGDAFASLGTSKTGPGSKFMQAFQRIKHNGPNPIPDPETIPLKMCLDENKVDKSKYDFETDEVLISGSDLKACFEPVIGQIIELIDQQVNETQRNEYPRIQTIILVGGFAGSELLWDTVRAWGTARDIGTIVSKHSWSAIARGAALRGFEGSKVPVTKCRRHYGYTINRPFDKERDDATDSTYEAEGVKMVKHCMEWIYQKNEELVHKPQKTRKINQYYYPHRAKKTLDLKIYFCNLSRAPDKRGTQTKILGTIVCNIKDIDMSRCDIVDPNKKRICVRIPLDITVRLSGEEGIIEVTVRWDNKVCGSGMLKFPDGQTITSHEC